MRAGSPHFKHAGLRSIEAACSGTHALPLPLNKGGVFKFSAATRLVHSDTNFSVVVRAGKKRRNAVAHLVAKYEVSIEEDEIAIKGRLGWAKAKQMTTFNLVVLRALMLTVGRFFPNLVRKLLQKLLITGKKTAPFRFARRFAWGSGQLRVSDELIADSWQHVEEGWHRRGADLVSTWSCPGRTVSGWPAPAVSSDAYHADRRASERRTAARGAGFLMGRLRGDWAASLQSALQSVNGDR